MGEKEKEECIWIGSKETCTICSDEGICRIKSKKKGRKRDRRIVGGEKSEEPREFMCAIMLQINEEKLESMASKSGRQQKKGKIQKNGKIKGKRLQRIRRTWITAKKDKKQKTRKNNSKQRKPGKKNKKKNKNKKKSKKKERKKKTGGIEKVKLPSQKNVTEEMKKEQRKAIRSRRRGGSSRKGRKGMKRGRS